MSPSTFSLAIVATFSLSLVNAQPFIRFIQPAGARSAPAPQQALAAAAPGSDGKFQVSYGTPAQDLLSFTRISKASPPPGANDPNCKSDKPPVVLVHGTGENQNNNWISLSPLLRNEGRCPWTFNFGAVASNQFTGFLPEAQGLGDITKSASELKAFVTEVLSKTGAKKVDLVGHSQGGMMPHVFIRDLDGASMVDKFVALAPSNRGTKAMESIISVLIPQSPIKLDISNMPLVGQACPACSQQKDTSSFITSLNAKTVTVPQVKYTVIVTERDSVVVPYTSQYLPNSDNVKNIKLQDGCTEDASGHIGISFSERALRFVLNALNDENKTPVCKPVSPLSSRI
jgi:triacylglycerol esterase/lipase EstA (alpha/beta hydrolase family)